jgi:hypothetical protein
LVGAVAAAAAVVIVVDEEDTATTAAENKKRKTTSVDEGEHAMLIMIANLFLTKNCPDNLSIIL